MTDRRYSEEEAAGIFRRAAELENSAPRALVPSEGLTLAQLQAIGDEAGLGPEFIVRAAQLQDVDVEPRLVRSLGAPIGVRHEVVLDHPLSDRDWETLVGELRATFDAKGSLRYDGPFRQWTNGNLQVLVEPTPEGSRVRFRTTNGYARSMIVLGIGGLAFAGFMALLLVLKGPSTNPAAWGVMGVFAAGGVATLGAGLARLPGWARTRAAQMRALTARLLQGPRAP
jgi:hypothetical protein